MNPKKIKTKDFEKEQLKIAEELSNDFIKLTKNNLYKKSRESYDVTTRTLFYKILNEINFMNDRQISDWFMQNGMKVNRSSIYQALNKIDIYYNSFEFFRNFYDVYFDDKKQSRKKSLQAKKKRLQAIKSSISIKALTRQKDKLDLIIEDLPKEKREEIFELVNLRVKSWSWKSKDTCKIYDSYESLSEYVH